MTTTHSPRRRLLLTATLLASLGAPRLAGANNRAWPTRPIRLINPNVPGGTTDIVARLVAEPLSSLLGQSVIVENRPGGNGNIGAALVAKADDAHSLLISDIPSLAISAALYTDLPYRFDTDLQGVAMLAYSPHVFAVHPALPARTLAELVALSRKQRINVALPFLGTPNHLATLQLAQETGLACQFVPYKGGSQAINDTVGGIADMVVTALAPLAPMIQSGRLRGLAISQPQRSTLLPEVATVAEQGLPDFSSGSWQGVTAPSSLSATHAEHLNTAFAQLLQDQALQRRLQELGAEPAPMELAAMRNFIQAESARWRAVLARAGNTLDIVN